MTDIDETKEEVKDENLENDKKGETEEEKTEEKENDDSFDETKIDADVLNYKPEAPVEDEEDDADEEDKARIQKIVEKQVGGKMTELEKKIEMDGFFNTNPELSKYRHAVELYKAHPSYSKVPIANLASMVASKDMLKIGAAKERAAQKAVEETKNPGTTVRKPSGEANDWLKAPKDDFEAKKAEVLGRMGN
jgi:hypothetical protein